MIPKAEIRLLTRHQGHLVSPNLYGIFFEDINFSCDGGINANMVNNYSFDGVYYDEQRKGGVKDALRFWTCQGGMVEACNESSLHSNSGFARIRPVEKCILRNLGFNGGKKHAHEPAMYIQMRKAYCFSCYLRTERFDGSLSVCVCSDAGQLTDRIELEVEAKKGWHQISLSLQGRQNGYGWLEIVFNGTERIDIDCVCLMDQDCWHANDPKWRHGKLRRDFVEALAQLKPAFMRFPGGCIVEGLFPGNEYNWKDTIGELYERRSNYSLWGRLAEHGGYNQSYQIGFYEYLCLCEDLNMKPLPVLSAGINCQYFADMRGEAPQMHPLESEAFDGIIDNYLDLLEFSNAQTGPWAERRAQMGHPAPFMIEFLGIGNENFGPEYIRRFEAIQKAVHEKWPDVRFVFSAGPMPFSVGKLSPNGLDEIWENVKDRKDIIIDEHSYHSPEWFATQSHRFDRYPRTGAKAYYGEYSANGCISGSMKPAEECNQLETALGEAAFLTGIERNSDFVVMSSYAPLFHMVDCEQWNHNLIDFNPRTLCLTANYFLLKMFANALGSSTVPIEAELPAGMYVSATRQNNHIFVKLVNVKDEHYEVCLTVENPAQAYGEVLCCDNPHARNQLDFYGEPIYSVKPKAANVHIVDKGVAADICPFSINVITIRLAA